MKKLILVNGYLISLEVVRLFSCSCGKLSKRFFNEGLRILCPLCGTGLTSQTKLNSFFQLGENYLGGRRKQVLDAIDKMVDPNNREIALFLELPINCITGRVKELRDMGLVEAKSKKEDTLTKTETTTWGTV